jgi:hypothetical protein
MCYTQQRERYDEVRKLWYTLGYSSTELWIGTTLPTTLSTSQCRVLGSSAEAERTKKTQSVHVLIQILK